jgi:hypothetical protein
MTHPPRGEKIAKNRTDGKRPALLLVWVPMIMGRSILMNRAKTGLLLALIISLCGCGRSAPSAPDDLAAIRILPQDPTLYLEQSIQLTVEGYQVDGTVVDLTNEPELIFRLNQDGIINVLSGAKILALQAGNVRLMAAFGGREDTVDVTVLYALLEGIQVAPDQLQLDVGDYDQLAVTGNLSDGSTLDLTDSATGTEYVTGDQLVATVTTEGMVFALKNGQTGITATHGEHQAVATVTVGELETIEVLPVPRTVRSRISPATPTRLILPPTRRWPRSTRTGWSPGWAAARPPSPSNTATRARWPTLP